MINLYSSLKKILSGLLTVAIFVPVPTNLFSQAQTIGNFPEFEGGFEAFAAGPLYDAGFIPVPFPTYALSSDISNTGNVIAGGARTGSKKLGWRPSGISKGLYTSSALSGAVANNTPYVVQFYYATSSATPFPAGVTPVVCVSPQDVNLSARGLVQATDISTTASPTGWIKKTIFVTSGSSAVSPRYGEIIFTCDDIGTNDIYFDDLVMYPGSAADVTAPNPVSAPKAAAASTTSLTVSWNTAAGGVDGGGYMVVRGTTDPSTTPNANGIYGVGSNLGSGVVKYIGTGTSFVDVGLVEGTPYYYRIYAVDKAFNYSSPVTVTGIPSPVGYAQVLTGATIALSGVQGSTGGTVVTDGGPGYPVIERGVVWGTAINPAFPTTDYLASGAGTGTFTAYPAGLVLGTLYYVRAYAITAAGTSYGPNASFTTWDLPVLTNTTPLTRVSFSSVTSGGTITSVGGAVTQRGVCLNTTGTPTIDDIVTLDQSSLVTGIYVSNVEGLTANTTYYIRAYATNPIGTVYGNQLSFTTLSACYNVAGADISQLSGWNSMPDGSGLAPLNFTTDKLAYNIRNAGGYLGGNLTITGNGARVVLGDGFNPISFTIPPAYAITEYLDVRNKATVFLQNTVTPKFNILYDGSTVNYDGSNTLSIAPNVDFYNLGSTNDVGITRILPSGYVNILGAFSPGNANYTIDPTNIIRYTGTAFQTIAAFNYESLTARSNAGSQTSGAVSVNRDLIFSQAVTVPVGSAIYMQNGSTISVGAGKTFAVRGLLEFRHTATLPAVIGGGVANIESGGMLKINGYTGSAAYPASGINFLTGSTFYVATGKLGLPANIGGNVVWDVPGTGVGNATFLRASGGDNTTIGGNLTIKSTGTGAINNGFGGATGRNLTVSGNLDMQGGEYIVNYASSAGTPQNLTVNGNLLTSGGRIYASGNSGATGNITIKGNLVDLLGEIGNKPGFTNGNITFSGTSAQTITTSGFVNEVSATINNSAGVTMLTNMSINNPATCLTLTNGLLNIGTHVLTLKGSIARTNGTLNATAGTLVLNGNTLQSIPASTLVSNTVKTLIVDNPANVSSLTPIKVLSDLALVNGTLDMTTNGLTVDNTITRTTGNILAANGALILDGTTLQLIPAFSILTNTIKDLTIVNNAGVTSNVDSIQVSGELASTAGKLDIENNILGIGGTFIRASGNIDADNGAVYLNGSSLLTVPSGAFAANIVRKLTINNAGGVNLNAVTNVLDTLGLNDGIVTTSAGILTLEQPAIITGNPGINAFINGPMAKKTNTLGEFEFPIGKTGSPNLYRPASIVPTETVGSTFIGEYFKGPTLDNSAPFLNSLIGLVNTEYWRLDRAAGSDKARVRLNYLNPNAGNWTPLDPDITSNVAVARYNTAGPYWGFANTSGNYSSNPASPEYRFYTDNGPVYSEELTAFGPFTIGFGSTYVLPIKLLSFDGRLANGSGLLHWEISTATGLAGFDIQHSTDGKNFSYIGTVAAMADNKNYSYTHASLPAGIHYYRLNVKEKSGKTYYSQIVIVTNGRAFTIISGLQQTMVNSDITTLIYSAKNQGVQAYITDNQGRRISNFTGRLTEGNNRWKLSAAPLSRGMYYIFVQTDDGVAKTLKFIKD